MKYFLSIITLLIVVTACHKNKEEPCPPIPYENSIMFIQTTRVISIIDKDSNNLLLNKTVDTAAVIVKDNAGNRLSATPWLDSTRTKVRYLELPLTPHEGTNSITINVKGQGNTFTYRYYIDRQRCYTKEVYDNFKLNSNAYNFMYKPDYVMRNYNNQWMKQFCMAAPLYVMAE